MLLLLYIEVFFTNNIYPNSSPLKTNKRKQKRGFQALAAPMSHTG